MVNTKATRSGENDGQGGQPRQSVADSNVGRDLNQIVVYGDYFHGSGGRIDLAAERLAESVRARLLQETSRRSLHLPAPLPVRWSSTGRPVQAAAEVLFGTEADEAPPDLRGELSDIVEAFRRLPHRQLVILGDPGAGKTVLAMFLALALLADPEPGDPVPVLFSLASYRPGTPFLDWMIARLAEDHPALADTLAYGPEAAARLIGNGRVLPVLDGLDEIPPELRGKTIAAIDHAMAAMTEEPQLVVTCRGDEYETAVKRSDTHLTRAAVVEIDEIDAATAVRYLRRTLRQGDERWRPLFDGILAAPEGPPARALSTPLMLFLARSAYGDPATDPSELLDPSRFPAREEVERHLLASFVPAVYASHREPAAQEGRPAYPAGKAERWLAFLARGGRDLRWWQLRSPVVHWTAALVFAPPSGWIFHLVWGAGPGIAGGALTGAIVAVTCMAGAYKWPEVDNDPRPATDLRANLRRYRRFASLWATMAAVAIGALIGLWFAAGLDAAADVTVLYALGCGAMFGLGTLVSTAWGAFQLTRLWYAATRRLPWGLPEFLDDAHRRTVLRQIGTVYQFRHAKLQDTLRHGRSTVFRDPPESPPRQGLQRIITFVPLLRLGGQVGAVLLPAVLFTATSDDTTIVYDSGRKPGRYHLDTPCVDASCPPVPVLWWRVPQGPAVATVFSAGDGAESRLPYRSLAGFARIKGCSQASIELTVTTAPSHRTLRAVGRADGFPLEERLTGRLPGELTSFTLALRRLDRDPCPVEVHLQGLSVTRDQLFDIRNRFN
ncbi:NACHT domain-containing protein [Spirillospora sp. CA-255316]